MLVPSAAASAETVVKASRFLSRIDPIADQEEVKTIVAGLREEHPGAVHVVWAYIWGKDRSVFGYSDDREPKGTAGRPVFEVLKGSGISNALLTVVRYFGGTKLGTGGLVRAYTDAAKAVLEQTETEERVDMRTMDISLDYGVFERIKLRLSELGGKLKDERFGEHVSLSLDIPAENEEEWIRDINDITSGRVHIEDSR